MEFQTLDLGAAVIQHLLPHRRPFLFVDRLTGLGLDPCVLSAGRFVSADDPVFEGHFPGFGVLPGALIFEGLGQCCALLAALSGLDLALAPLVGDLVALEASCQVPPALDPGATAGFRARIAARASIGMVGATHLKFVAPVLPGCWLDYRVERTGHQGKASHFRVQASVGSVEVVRGTLSASARG